MQIKSGIISICAASAILIALSCSDEPVVSEPSLAALPIDILPLANGAQWRYSLRHTVEENVEGVISDRFGIRQTLGQLNLAVRDEHGFAFRRTWELAASLTIDSVHYEQFIDGVPDTSWAVYLNSTEIILFTIEYEQDTLWYRTSKGRDYMTTIGYRPGGTIDLRLFDYAENGFFSSPLDSAVALGNGDLVFHSFRDRIMTAAKVTPALGPIGVWGYRVDGDPSAGHNWRLEELRFGLIR